MSGEIRIEDGPPVATVWIDNPAKRNAIDLRMWQQLGDAFEAFGRVADLRCIVVRGAGEQAFGSGADIEGFGRVRADSRQATEFARWVHRAMHSVRGCPVPVVAAIRGFCVGGGLELAAVCDLRFCTQDSRSGVPIARLGATLA
jgi:enoyl-CoA hydratase